MTKAASQSSDATSESPSIDLPAGDLGFAAPANEPETRPIRESRREHDDQKNDVSAGRTRIAIFIGTRPEAIKLAPVIQALSRESDVEPVVVLSGQHRELVMPMIDHFGIPVQVDLDVMAPDQSLSGLSAKILQGVDDFLAGYKPAMAIVQGDTNTMWMAALACFYRRVPVAHVEAGLRTESLEAPFPEEANRRLAALLVRWHYAPTEGAKANLLREGVAASSIRVTGNTVIDALYWELERQRAAPVRAALAGDIALWLGPDWESRPFVLVTGHRREHFGEGLTRICAALERLATRFPDTRWVYPLHLNPRVSAPVRARLGGLANVALIPPQDYPHFIAMLRQCEVVLTDSGGVQEEAPAIGKPTLVMRESTERPEAVGAGQARLVGADVERIVAEVSRLLHEPASREAMSRPSTHYGDGHAAARIVEHLRSVRAFGQANATKALTPEPERPRLDPVG